MAIDRTIWQTYVDVDFENSYPCPRCSKGRVFRADNPVVLVEPHHSAREHGEDEWDPEWIVRSFTTMLTCDNKSCGEVVAVSGHGGVQRYDYYGDNGEQLDSGYTEFLHLVSMFPAPPLFPISKRIPTSVQDELRLAFQLFWTNRSASTSRLRTSLERLLDAEGIATSRLVKKNKPQRLSLFDRIDLFEKATQEADIAESMNALRVVGNLGTHGDEVTEGDYFNLLDVYEDALAEIYEKKTARLKEKKVSLIELKKPH